MPRPACRCPVPPLSLLWHNHVVIVLTVRLHGGTGGLSAPPRPPVPPTTARQTTTRGPAAMPTTRTPPTPARLLTGWYTSVADGYSHALTNAASIQGVHQRHGQRETACGPVICLGASAASSGRPCPRCSAFLRARATPHPPADTGPRRRRLSLPRRGPGRHASGVSA